jgi:hypothetical protein
MRRLLLCAAALTILVAVGAVAQGPATSAADPRVNLKPGLRNAGVATRNMELVASLPKPRGFFDPASPGGLPTPPEPDPKLPNTDPAVVAVNETVSSALSFANSDLAFSGNYAVMGSFHGFNTYDVESSGKPRLVTSVVCPGGQGDVSIYGSLLFMSVEQTLGRIDCGSGGVQGKVSADRFRGVRIFDISDIKRPKQIAAVQTCRGSHTHTLVVDPKDKANVYIYGSGTGSVRPGEELTGCSGSDPKDDPNTSLFSIDVIQVPLNAPAQARIVNQPRVFADQTTGAIAALWRGGDHGPGTQKTSETNRCHDITVFPDVGLAAGACSGNGILLDISDPVHPVRLDAVADKNFAFWHSATFNNDGKPGFVTDPTRGVSANDILSGKVPLPPQTTRILSPDFKMPYTWQYSIGFQKQLSSVMSVESDLTGWDWYRDTRSHDPNLFFDPTTGYNVDPRFGRPNPAYGQISYFTSNGRRDYLGLSNGFTRRLSHSFQGGVTYTLMFFMHDDGTIGYSSSAANNDFTAPGSEWATSTDFQRNTVRAWALYQLPWGVSISGAYFYGSGNRYATTVSGTPYGKPGTNRLNLGAPILIPQAVVDRFDGPAVIATGAVAPRTGTLRDADARRSPASVSVSADARISSPAASAPMRAATWIAIPL